MQNVPFECSPFKSKNIGAEEDKDETMKEAAVETANRRNKRRRLISDPASSRRLQKKKMRVGPNRSDTGRKANVCVGENLTKLELNHKGSGINSHSGCGRGKRTLRRRPERRNNDGRNYPESEVGDVAWPKEEEEEEEEEEELFRDMDEGWAGETPSRMVAVNTEAVDDDGDDDDDDESGGNSIEPVDSDDNDGTLEYNRSNWGLDWSSNMNEASEDEEDDGNGVERAEDGGVAAYMDDAEMSESSDDDGVPNNTGKDFDRDSGVSEDYSSDS